MGGMFSNPEAKIVVVGLDNAGKSTLLHRMKESDESTQSDITATVGFNEESFTANKINFTAFDMSG